MSIFLQKKDVNRDILPKKRINAKTAQILKKNAKTENYKKIKLIHGQG